MKRMSNTQAKILVICLAIAGSFMMSTVVGAQGVSPSMMRACHDAVWQQRQFQNIPNAGISIDGGDSKPNGRARVHWRVDWERKHARGICIVDKKNQVINLEIQSVQNDKPQGAGQGIYFDTRSRRWKTSDGQVCYTCTPENGFSVPRVDGPFYYDPKIGQWRDSSHQGAICHTCTPENGFGHSSGGGGGWKSSAGSDWGSGSGDWGSGSDTDLDALVAGILGSGSSSGGWGSGGDGDSGYGVTLHRDPGLRGTSQTFSSDARDLRGSYVGNDQATSVSVSGGCRARLYQDPDFRGAYTEVNSDIYDLRGSHVGNDSVTSLQVHCDGSGWGNSWGGGWAETLEQEYRGSGLTLFRDPHYGGTSETFADDVPDLRGSRVGDDEATSVSLSPGCRARLFQDPNFRGAYTEVNSDIPDLRGARVGDDSITSIQVRCNR